MVYFRNLDFLRFIAVSFVILQHWFLVHPFIEFGTIGVTIFFVLSGFLITRILLNNKEQVISRRLTLREAFINFYVRRSIRIFPIYFLLLGFLVFFKYKQVLDNIWWYLTYTSNFKTFFSQNWLNNLGPLWSLAVEEQFYFIWPALILLFSINNIKKILVSCLILGPIFRMISMIAAIFLYSDVDLHISSIVLMPSNIDLFAIGGILAYNIKYETQIITISKNFILGGSFFVFILIMLVKDSILYHLLFVQVISIWSYYLIVYLIDEKNSHFNRLFQFEPFSYLGRISYGLYLYHGPFFFIFGIISFSELKIFGDNFIFSDYQQSNHFLFLKNVLYLILIATVSWFFIEKPINKLKHYFT